MKSKTKDNPYSRGDNGKTESDECDEKVGVRPLKGQGRPKHLSIRPVGPKAGIDGVVGSAHFRILSVEDSDAEGNGSSVIGSDSGLHMLMQLPCDCLLMQPTLKDGCSSSLCYAKIRACRARSSSLRATNLSQFIDGILACIGDASQSTFGIHRRTT